jgi:hypothetical protein
MVIKTKCAHCDRVMQIEIDSDLKFRVEEEGAEPLVFEPHINWETFIEPNIINAF